MITQSSFKPAWWLRNRHIQTIWPSLFRVRPNIQLRRERLELPDGDFLDLDWTTHCDGPLVIVLHGLEGNRQSHYTKTLLYHLSTHGYNAVIMYFRGCSGEMNRLPRAYHSGETGDISYVVSQLLPRFSEQTIHAIGISLGGNVLLKWLGETASKNPLSSAIAISVPFDLANATQQLNRPESKIYQRHLMNKLLHSLQQRINKMSLPLDIEAAIRCQTIRDYDDKVTAPLHGFKSAEDYYKKSSSLAYLSNIQIPTLILHALDDPFMTQSAIPKESDLSANVRLELSAHGGHVGFIAGHIPFRAVYWLEKRITDFLRLNSTV